MKTTHHLEWLELPVEIRRHIEWVENWAGYPGEEEPTINDYLLAEDLILAWEDGCPMAEILAIWNCRKPA